MRAGQRAGDDLGELPRLLVGVAPLDRDEDVHALAAARLGERGEAERVQHLLDEERNLDHLREARVLGRIEIEEHEVGAVRLVHP